MNAESQANALTVDVEEYFHVSALAGSIDRGDWPRLPSRVEGSTRRLLDIFDEYGVRGTLFVLGWVAERFPSLVADIHRRGHEVACHGLSHSLIYNQKPEQFASETKRSKELLEAVIGEPVLGYRAASYSITKDSLWALDIIIENGFKYDSSIVPVRHDLYGIPGFLPSPHRLRTEKNTEIAEFPPTTVSVAGQRIPVGGGGYFRLYPYPLTRRLLRWASRQSGYPFAFYLHPWEIDPSQPRVKAGAMSTFRHYHNLEKCEARLRRLLKDFRFGTMRAVLEGLNLLSDSNP